MPKCLSSTFNLNSDRYHFRYIHPILLYFFSFYYREPLRLNLNLNGYKAYFLSRLFYLPFVGLACVTSSASNTEFLTLGPPAII